MRFAGASSNFSSGKDGVKAAERQGLLADLLQRAQSHELTPDGLEVAFSADGETLATIARVVDAERQCCRFLRFVITVAPDGGPLTLELSGPGGTREFLAALLEL